MGVSLEDAILHMKRRMPSDDMNLFTTAVLVVRETGGDITHIFGQLVETIRERKKLIEKVKSLTFMARAQGVVMAALPFGFGFMVYQMNKNYFDFFLHDPVGRFLLLIVIIMQIVGGALFVHFSKSPI